MPRGINAPFGSPDVNNPGFFKTLVSVELFASALKSDASRGEHFAFGGLRRGEWDRYEVTAPSSRVFILIG